MQQARGVVRFVVLVVGLGMSHVARAEVQISGGPGKGVSLSLGEDFSLNIRARIQPRYQLNVLAPDEDLAGEREVTQLVNIGTARVWLSGHVLRPDVLYMIQLAVAGRDYRDSAISPVFDAFLEWKLRRDFNFRVGQYFVPFDRLRTVREFALQLTDRPRPITELTLDRDVGVTFYSDKFLGDASPIAWRIGAFGGGGTNLSVGKKVGGLFVGRLEFRPLGEIDDDSEGDLMRREKPAIAIGGGVAYNLNTNRARSTTGATFIDGTTTDYLNTAADVVFKWHGFALEAEYLLRRASNDFVTSDTGRLINERTRSGRGWVVQASYVFDPPIEIVGRISRTYAFRGTDPAFIEEVHQRGRELAAGLNYYINGHRFKIQTDWIALMPPDFEFNEAEHIMHAQVDVTF